jgi:hypothetical protein
MTCRNMTAEAATARTGTTRARAILFCRGQWLAQSQVVAAGVADAGVADTVRLVDGLLEDLLEEAERVTGRSPGG